MKDTKAVGDTTEAMILAQLLKAGYRVLLPFGERHKYDLVVEHNSGCFMRVQCKTGKIIRGAIRFNTSSVSKDAKTKKYVKRYYTSGDIDAYGIYVPELDRSYLVPISVVARTEGCLRVEPTLRNIKKVRTASDFAI